MFKIIKKCCSYTKLFDNKLIFNLIIIIVVVEDNNDQVKDDNQKNIQPTIDVEENLTTEVAEVEDNNDENTLKITDDTEDTPGMTSKA